MRGVVTLKIVEISADNYRNLDGMTVRLSADRTFAIGENNLVTAPSRQER